MEISSEQRRVAMGMAGALIVSTFVVVGAIYSDVGQIVEDTLMARFRFASPFLLLPVLSLAAGVAAIAKYRFFNVEVIDGSNPASNKALQIKRAYLQNTVEQVLLALPIYWVLTVMLPPDWLGLVAVLPVWFTVCRILFRLGYGGGAVARSFGFAGTFYSTLIGALIAVWFSVVGW